MRTTAHGRYLPCVIASLIMAACHPATPPDEPAVRPVPSQALPPLEWTGADETPRALSSTTVIAGPHEIGERLVLTGTVLAPDGATPVADVIVYAYHTNAAGIYPKRGDESGNARRHGYLRGWVRTGPDGRYRFETIRPAPYPSRTEPAHIHMTVKAPGRDEYWLDSVLFAGDPLLTDAFLAKSTGRGGPGVVTLRRDARGIWHGERPIILDGS